MYIVSNTGLEIPQQKATNPGSNETPPTLQLAPYSSQSDVTSPDTMPLLVAPFSQSCRPTFDAYANKLRSSYQGHSLFPKDAWPPRLSEVYINLALVQHENFPVDNSLKDFVKATLHGTVDDLIDFHKYNINLEDILKPDEFFQRKEKSVQDDRNWYVETLQRLLNSQVPAGFMRKKLGISDDVGKGLPNAQQVHTVLEMPSFFRHTRLRKLFAAPVAETNPPSVSPDGAAGTGSPVTPQTHTSEASHPDQKGVKVLIDGAPGVGKTTLTWKISQDWACGKLFSEYKLVVRISLRDLPSNLQRISDLLPTEGVSMREVRDAVAKVLEDSRGEDIMFILDGWDELSPSLRKRDSLLCKLVRGDILPLSSVVVTSRPYTSRWLQLPDMVPRHIEIFGFTQEQIMSCIQKTFITDAAAAKKLIKLLEVRTDIFKLCYIPHNLSIVIYIYRASTFQLPETLTQLYEQYTNNTIMKHMQKEDEDSESCLYLENKDKLPKEVLELYESLCTVALNGLLENKMVFSDTDLESINPLLGQKANTLGLMTAYKSFTPFGIKRSFQFIHTTIQEFLAAEALTKQPAEKQIEFFLENINKPHFRMVLILYAGKADLKAFECIFQVPITYAGYQNIDRLLLLSQMAYEAQNPDLCHHLAQQFPESSIELSRFTSIHRFTVSEFDCLMLRYLLFHSSTSWKALEVPSQYHLQEFVNTLAHAPKEVSFQELHVSSGIPDSVFEAIAEHKIAAFQKLKAVKIHISSFISKAVSTLLNMCGLTHLHIDCDDQEGFESAMEVTSHNLSLQYLSMRYTDPYKHLMLSPSTQLPLRTNLALTLSFERFGMTDEFAFLLAQSVDQSGLIGKLYFESCILVADHMQTLFSALKSSKSVSTLHIRQPPSSKPSWDDKTQKALQEMLAENTSITILTLDACGIDAHVQATIADAFEYNQSLQLLDLSHNSFSTTNLARFLSVRCLSTDPATAILKSVQSLQILKLTVCKLTDEHASTVAMLISSPVHPLKELDLTSNSIREGGANCLFTALERNNSLKVFEFGSNPIWLTHGQHIETMLTHNQCLTRLGLHNSGLHIPAIQGLSTGLARNSALTSLELGVSLRQTDTEGACYLFSALKTNSSLSELTLHGYKLLSDGTNALADCLTHNEMLRLLVFRRCKFGSTADNRRLVDCLYTHRTICEFSVSETENILKQVFAEYDKINWQRKRNHLPYLQVTTCSGSQLPMQVLHEASSSNLLL